MAENQPLKNRVITTSFPEISAPLRALTDEEFETRALRLFAFQFENNRAYRRLCHAGRVDPGSVGKWQDIPAAPTAGFKEFEMSCLAPHERTTVFHSSGTTGQRPSRHFHSAGSLAIYEEALRRGFRQNVLNEQSVCVLALTPRADQAPHSSLVHMFEWVARSRRREEADGIHCPSDPPANERSAAVPAAAAPHAHKPRTLPNRCALESAAGQAARAPFIGLRPLLLGGAPPPHVGGYQFVGYVNSAGEWLLDLDKAVFCLETLCSQQQPVCILGTAFLFVHLLDNLRDRKLRFKLPAGSVLMETGGYKGRSRSIPRSELHEMICDAFRVTPEQIVCEYGMSELSSQAYAKASGASGRGKEGSRVFCFPGWCRAQIISPETGREVNEGETGLIRVFDLANVYSVMAVQTEDLGTKRGSGFELIGRAALSEPRGCSLMSASQ